MTTPLFTEREWKPELLARVTEEISRIAEEELRLDCFPMHICTITSEQMLDAYAMNGMPVNYAHWSYGKHFLRNQRAYDKGMMGLAYEIVINTNPCQVYCMEENSMTMQALVIAHAGFGHNHFFKNNHLFKQWTDPTAIIDYLKFARDFVTECEEKHGEETVQDFLSACHAWQLYGVDRYKRPRSLSAREEKERMHSRATQVEQNLNTLWRFIPKSSNEKKGEEEEKDEIFPKEPQENILYFIEKNAPSLPSWKRELIRIVRKEAQYFYPQRLTKVMNEGFATFTHHYIMTRLWEKGLITEGAYQEFLVSHTNVIRQPAFDDPHYTGMNPYALGFAMFTDIKRICETPTAEDRKWFPELAGTPWVDSIKWAAENFTDNTFIEQYLSPKVIRDLRLFAFHDDDQEEDYIVSAIHDDDGYRDVRVVLARTYDTSTYLPNIQVVDVDLRGTRALVLRHECRLRRHLEPDETSSAMQLLHQLWEYPVVLQSMNESGGVVERWGCDDGEKVSHTISSEN